MTAEERAFFEAHGYVVVHDALPEADHAALLAALDALRDEKIAEGRHPAEQLRQPVFSPAHDLAKQKVVQDLVCPAKIFPKVVDILGINLFLYHGYIVGDRAAPAEASVPEDFDAVPTFGFHQDSGMQNDIRNGNYTGTICRCVCSLPVSEIACCANSPG